jgi:hypothetical protein
MRCTNCRFETIEISSGPSAHRPRGCVCPHISRRHGWWLNASFKLLLLIHILSRRLANPTCGMVSGLRLLLRQFIRSRRHHQLKPGFRRELILHTFGDGLEVSFCLGLKLNVSGERLDPRVLERKALGTNGAYKLNRADAMRLLGEDQVATRRTDPRLDISQDGFAGFSFV